jgi:hypothetical protein
MQFPAHFRLKTYPPSAPGRSVVAPGPEIRMRAKAPSVLIFVAMAGCEQALATVNNPVDKILYYSRKKSAMMSPVH